MYKHVGSSKLVPRDEKDTGDTEHVIAPCSGSLLGQVVEIKLEVAGKFFGANHEFTIGRAAMAT